ncbi:MAG: hypothetical protein WC770_09970 [Phycisphaerae bacterium]|jgi:hypothetical protein
MCRRQMFIAGTIAQLFSIFLPAILIGRVDYAAAAEFTRQGAGAEQLSTSLSFQDGVMFGLIGQREHFFVFRFRPFLQEKPVWLPVFNTGLDGKN